LLQAQTRRTNLIILELNTSTVLYIKSLFTGKNTKLVVSMR